MLMSGRGTGKLVQNCGKIVGPSVRNGLSQAPTKHFNGFRILFKLTKFNLRQGLGDCFYFGCSRWLRTLKVSA